MTLNWFLLELCLFFVLLILSGIFSSAEVAYTSLSMGQISRIKRLKSKILDIWEHSPELVLAVLLLSNNAVNIAVGVIAAGMSVGISVLIGWPEPLISVGMGIFSGIILLIFGEIIPKIWGKQYPVSWALRISPPLNIWIRLLKPIARGAVWITNKIVLGRIRKSSSKSDIRNADLKEVLTHSVIPSTSRHILNNLIEFSATKVRDVMTPRTKIEAVSIREQMHKIIMRVIKSGYSRIPIYSGTIDNMIGVLYSKDLLVAWKSGTLIIIEDLIRPLHTVTEDMPLSELMRVFKSGRHHLAIVKDVENKKVKGLVTLEDALENIVGEIKEE